jgi:hypothetical protein
LFRWLKRLQTTRRLLLSTDVIEKLPIKQGAPVYIAARDSKFSTIDSYSLGKAVTVKVRKRSCVNWLDTTPWRRMGQWRYSLTILDLGTRWGWVVSFTSRKTAPGIHWIEI